jgi:CHASE2 domain-containing sensor protein
VLPADEHASEPRPAPSRWARLRAELAARRRRAPIGLGRVLAIALSFWVLLLFDPFELGSGSQRRSEEVAARLAATQYTGSNRVAVVLVDDDYLERLGSAWPPSYAAQGRLIRQILGHGPRALFVDVLYSHRHGRAAGDQPGDLLAPIERDRTVPVYLPTMVRAGARELCPGERGPAGAVVDPAAVIAPLRQSDRFRWSLVGWYGCGDGYPNYLANDAVLARTPAFAMFADDCAGPSPAAPDACRGLRPGGDPEGRFLRPMIIRWGAFPPSGQAGLYGPGTCQAGAAVEGGTEVVPPLLRLRALLGEALLGMFVDLRERDEVELHRPCPAVNVVPATLLLDGDPRVGGLLRDRFVFLGTRVAGLPDWQTSPVHGQVPGVVLHAAALDNLLRRGDRYARGRSALVGTLASLGLLVALAFWQWWRFGREPPRTLAPAAPGPGRAWWVLPALGLLVWLALGVAFGAAGMWLRVAVCAAFAVFFDLMRPLETGSSAVLVGALGGLTSLLETAGMTSLNWMGLALVAKGFTSALHSYVHTGDPSTFPHGRSLLGMLWARLRAPSTGDPR